MFWWLVNSTFFLTAMDQVMQFVDPARQFAKDSIRLVKKCTKPDRKGRCMSVYCLPRENEQMYLFFEVFYSAIHTESLLHNMNS